MKETGTKPDIPGPSQMQQQDPPEDSEEQSESQQSESDQGGDGEDEGQEEDSVKTISDANQPDKHKSPEAEEVTKPQS